MRTALQAAQAYRFADDSERADRLTPPVGTKRHSALMATAAANMQPRLFEGLAEPHVQTILANASFRRAAAKTIVTTQGEPADYLFLIAKGCARHFYVTADGQKIILIWLGQGEVFGGYALLPTGAYLLGTEIVRDSSLFVWSRPKIQDLLLRYPQLTHNALSLASEYLTWFLSAHVALLSHSASERLAHILLSLAQGIGHKARGGLELDITNEQLANAANITVFTTSRLLSQWQRNGAITKSRGKVLLRSPERLFSHFG
jgi:CRP/FNR family transcriptional regulator, nitrogen oxide reductase regulator